MSALTTKQKAYLAQLATRAWRMECAKLRGQGVDEDQLPKAEAWRHEAVIAACGKIGLRCCDQRDYKLVEGNLLEALGNHGAAFNAQMRAATESRRQAEAVLVRECGRAGVHLAYAAAICQRQYRCSLDDANERQIWSLVFTIRNRAAKRREAQAA